MINSKHKGGGKRHLNSSRPRVPTSPFKSYIASYVMEQIPRAPRCVGVNCAELGWVELTPVSFSIIDLESPLNTGETNNDSNESLASRIH